MTRRDILPVQVVTAEGTSAVPSFRDLGEHGVSSAVFDDLRMFFSLGDDLAELDLDTGVVVRHPVPGLRDVHEMTYRDSSVVIANTGMDEVVAFSIAGSKVTRRITLDRFRRATFEDSSDRKSTRLNSSHVKISYA